MSCGHTQSTHWDFEPSFTLLESCFASFAKNIKKIFIHTHTKKCANNISDTHDGNQFANYFTVHLNSVCMNDVDECHMNTNWCYSERNVENTWSLELQAKHSSGALIFFCSLREPEKIKMMHWCMEWIFFWIETNTSYLRESVLLSNIFERLSCRFVFEKGDKWFIVRHIELSLKQSIQVEVRYIFFLELI